jgi:DNA-binding NtrC family response regulator
MALSDRILVLDDEPGNLATLRFNFGRRFNLLESSSPAQALELLNSKPCAVLLVDQRMPEMEGLEFIKRAREICPRALAILLTAYTDIEVVIDALNSGLVYRYLRKPWDRAELEATLRQALELHLLEEENRQLVARLEQVGDQLGKDLEQRGGLDHFVAESQAMKQILERVSQVAPTNSSVLVTGESGTGKELVAREVHRRSQRSAGPFISVNCGALSPGIIESELFGHEKGSFTGALARKAGRFELANRGTLFLDEVGDLSAEVQVKLLRVLQEREFERVGGDQTLKVDFRLICATHRNLEELVRQGQFREDLFFRISVFPIHLAPLRERPEDIGPLADHFLQRLGRDLGRAFAGFSGEARSLLATHPWPGNVRELENAVERAMITADTEWIEVDELAFLATGRPPRQQTQGRLEAMLDALERREIQGALERCENSVTRAAEDLGVKRTALYYKMKKHGLDK